MRLMVVEVESSMVHCMGSTYLLANSHEPQTPAKPCDWTSRQVSHARSLSTVLPCQPVPVHASLYQSMPACASPCRRGASSMTYFMIMAMLLSFDSGSTRAPHSSALGFGRLAVIDGVRNALL